MSNTARTIILFSILCVVFVGGCSQESSDTTEANAAPATTSTTSEAPEAKTTAETTELASNGGQTDAAPSNGDATEAYAKLLEDIRAAQQAAKTQDELFKALNDIEKQLAGFVQRFPSSDEALDAKFQLGMLYTSLGKPELVVRNLKDYVDNAVDDGSGKVGYAQFYLAEGYKASDQFEDAKRHYLIFQEKYSHLNARFTGQAAMSLEDMETMKKLRVGAEPIPFEVTDIKGKKLSLDQYKGKVVLLDFWATWCGPCKAEMPELVRMYKKYKDKGFDMVGISADHNRAALESYVKSSSVDWRQHYDGYGGKLGMKYRIRAYPTKYLIDKKGKIRGRFEGMIRGPKLENEVKKLLEEA